MKKISHFHRNGMPQPQRLLTIFLFSLSLLLCAENSSAQVYNASPSNWLYPRGNSEGTLLQRHASLRQPMDSLVLRWASTEISGDVQPLIGNIVNNPPLLSALPLGPNEITALVQNNIVVLGASGRLISRNLAPNYVQQISALMDTIAADPTLDVGRPVVMGLETIEFENLQDTLGLAYMAGFNQLADTTALLGRFTVNLRPFAPNFSAAVRPVFGRSSSGASSIYALVSMYSDSGSYFRGLTQFNTSNSTQNLLFRDIGDVEAQRLSVAPDVLMSQPSLSTINGRYIMFLPTGPRGDTSSVTNFLGQQTFSHRPYVLSAAIENPQIGAALPPLDLSLWIDTTRSRPRITPYIVNIGDGSGAPSQNQILVSEEYEGRNGSAGISRLHLFDGTGAIITSPDSAQNLPFAGKRNHLWAIASGDVDGVANNTQLPYFPNNPGNEIIATQSTREFAFAGSRIFVLRYKAGARTPKPSPAGSFLFPFDTIVSVPFNGWLAAVSDFDGAANARAEIFIVNNSRFHVLTMRDYADLEFKFGRPFDTVFSYDFPNETISSLEVADLDGDGRNEIITTTQRATYTFGQLLPGMLRVTTPVLQQTPPQNYCANDTVRVSWENVLRNSSAVNVYFRPYNGTTALDTLIPVRQNLANSGDSASLALPVSAALVTAGEGRFIVVNSAFPVIRDSSAILAFSTPGITLTQTPPSILFSGGQLALAGTGLCVDSVRLEHSLDGISWSRLDQRTIASDGSFSLSAAVPCLDVFPCGEADSTIVMNFRIIGFKNTGALADTISNIFSVLRPAPVAVTFFPDLQTACPTRTISWNIALFNAASCDTLSLSYSADRGRSFVPLTRAARQTNSFLWQTPTGLPDSLLLRFCCESSCIRFDTLIYNSGSRLVNIIAPNPFVPQLHNDVQIIYSVPSQSSVTIRVYDQNNHQVAEPVSEAARSNGIIYCDRWDGKNFDGELVANGMYYLSIEVSDGSREVYHLFVRKRD